MGIRKCVVPDCPSSTARSEDRGVTFHKIPFHEDMKGQWIDACHLPDDFRTTKTTNVCSRHFRKADFQEFQEKKYVLKFGVVPTVFPWTIVSSPAQPPKSPVKSDEHGDDGEEFQHEVGDKDGDVVLNEEVQSTIKEEKTDSPTPKSDKKARMESPSASPSKKQSPRKTPSSSKRTPAKPAAEEGAATGSGLEKGIDFTLGVKLEVQDFSGRWHPVCLIEVDTEEREVLVQFDKAEKMTTSEEWISMDSIRLRPQQSSIFAISDKVFRRKWETAAFIGFFHDIV